MIIPITRPLFVIVALFFGIAAVGQETEVVDRRQKRQEAEHILAQEEARLLAVVSRYRGIFVQAAKTQLANRPSDTSVLKKLREEVSRLNDTDELTEELISEVEPNLQRLEQLLMIDRQTVLGRQPELLEERDVVSRQCQEWERAVARWNDLASEPYQTLASRPTRESLLIWHERLATQLALPIDDPSRKILIANGPLAGRLGPEEANSVHMINRLRILLGRRPLKIDLALTAASRDHAHAMRTREFFSHESPIKGKKLPEDRARHFGSRAWSENIAWGYSQAEPIIEMWIESPPHLANMIDPNHRRVGVGRNKTFWTLMLGESIGF